MFKKNKLYKTESGSYILDLAGSKVGDVPDAPIILINEKLSRGAVTQSLYSFNSFSIFPDTKFGLAFSVCEATFSMLFAI